MDLVKKISSTLGSIIADINEEDEEQTMELVLNMTAQIKVRHLIDWLNETVKCLPEDATLMDVLEEKYDDILEENANMEALFTDELLAELREKFGYTDKGEET